MLPTKSQDAHFHHHRSSPFMFHFSFNPKQSQAPFITNVYTNIHTHNIRSTCSKWRQHQKIISFSSTSSARKMSPLGVGRKNKVGKRAKHTTTDRENLINRERGNVCRSHCHSNSPTPLSLHSSLGSGPSLTCFVSFLSQVELADVYVSFRCDDCCIFLPLPELMSFYYEKCDDCKRHLIR